MINKKVQKTTFTTQNAQKVINRSFSTFTPEQQIQAPNIEEFFSLYDELFYLIPIEGETNSHEYIVQQSSKLTQIDAESERIQELTEQVQQLLEQNLELREQVLNLEIQNAQQ